MSIEANANRIFRSLGKSKAKDAGTLGRALGYADGRAISRPLAKLVREGRAARVVGGYVRGANA